MGNLCSINPLVLLAILNQANQYLRTLRYNLMNIRNYNKFFHLHTISGIIITAVLFVFFFAGSFAFFKNEINNWQNNTPKSTFSANTLDYNTIVDSINTQYGLYGRNISFRITDRSRVVGLVVSPSKDTLNPKASERSFVMYDTASDNSKTYAEGYSLGEFLYRLHFLAPVNSLASFSIPLGYLIAGLVSFAFLFAILTGALVHWKKIVSNFYVFRPWEKLKTVWTDLHTALGVISFPFQLIFAITGSYFFLTTYFVANAVASLGYGGDVKKLQEDVGGRKAPKTEIAFANIPLQEQININAYVQKTLDRWEDGIITYVEVSNYGDQNMQIKLLGKVAENKQFNSKGEIIYHIGTGEVEEKTNPNDESTYSEVVSNLMYVLHFGAFGGYAVRIAYFLMGIAGCFVIISGVLIWLVARDKKNVPERKRKFNFWLANIYIAICLSMYPVTALAFIAVKVNPNGGQPFIYSFYFYTWLAVTLLLAARKSIYKTNRDCLLIGSIIGLLIPITNGIVTGDWFWSNWKKQYYDILIIDVFWIIIPLITLFAWYLVRKKHEIEKSAN